MRIFVLYLRHSKNRLSLDSALQKTIKAGPAHTLTIATIVNAVFMWSGLQRGKEKMSEINKNKSMQNKTLIYVKKSFNHKERMWVKIIAQVAEGYIGIVSNIPVCDDSPRQGELVFVKHEEILDYWYGMSDKI